MDFTFELTRPATGKGGDRYEANIMIGEKPWVIYVPQRISRNNEGQPYLKVKFTIEVSNDS